MKLISLYLLLIFTSLFRVSAQQQFIKLLTQINHSSDSNNHFIGNFIQAKPTPNNGFVVISTDSNYLFKFNECGNFEWGHQYNIIDKSNSPYSFVDLIASNNYYYVLSRDIIKNKSVVTKIDPNSSGALRGGDVIWDKTYSDSQFSHYPYSIRIDNDGNIIFFGNIQIAGSAYNLLVKLDPDGNIIWSKKYNFGGFWGGCITTSDNGVLFRTGNILIKTNSNGDTEWASTINLAGNYYYEPLEIVDGFIFNSYSNLEQKIIFHKIDKNGNEILRKKNNQSLSSNHNKITTENKWQHNTCDQYWNGNK